MHTKDTQIKFFSNKRFRKLKNVGKEVRFKNTEIENFPLYHNKHYKYCHKYVSKKHKLKDRRQFIELTRFIMQQIITGIIEEKDGVYLEGIGYFYNFLIPKPRKYRKGNLYNHVMNREYYTCFVATGKNNPLSDFHIPFISPITSEVKRRLRQGQLYTSNLSLLLDPDQYTEIQNLEFKHKHKRK